MDPITASRVFVSKTVPSVHHKYSKHTRCGRWGGYRLGHYPLHDNSKKLRWSSETCWWGRSLWISIKLPRVIDVGWSEGAATYWNNWLDDLVVWIGGQIGRHGGRWINLELMAARRRFLLKALTYLDLTMYQVSRFRCGTLSNFLHTW